jgi:DNA-binding transcriptional LysR family regulator
MAAHPQLRVTLQLEDHRQDLISQGIDVALRFGALEDSSAVARKMRSWPRIAAASPGYLAKAGVPQNPADLASCQVLLRPGLFEDRHPALFEMKRNGLSRAAIEVHMMKQGAGRSSMWRR